MKYSRAKGVCPVKVISFMCGLVLLLICGCENSNDTAMLGALLTGNSVYATNPQQAAAFATLGNSATGYANAQASSSQVTINEMGNESRTRHKYNAQETQTAERHQYRNAPQSTQDVETIVTSQMGMIFNEASREGVAIGYDKTPDRNIDLAARDYVISNSFNSTDQIWLFVFVHPSSTSCLVVKDTASGEVFNKLTFQTPLNSSAKPVILSSSGFLTAPAASGTEDIRLLTFEVYRNNEKKPFAKRVITIHYREGRR